MLAFKKKFADATGRIVIQDLPSVFDDVHYHDLGLEKIGYDVFSPQPTKGKRNSAVHFSTCISYASQLYLRTITLIHTQAPVLIS
jgi:hypothetical protein